MKQRKLAMLACAGLVAAALMACGGGDDDGSNPDNPDTGTTDQPDGGGTDAPPGDGGTDGNVDLTSFPAYVKSLIENKTDDKGSPDQESVWGSLPDDEAFVYPTTFF